MKNTRLPALVCLIFGSVMGSALIAGTTGCKGSGSSASAPAPQVEQAKAFIAALKALPASERQAYVKSHQTEVDNLNRSGDPSLTSELMQLMRPTGP